MSATLRECEEAMQEVMPKYEHFGTPLEEDISDEQRLVQMQVMHALQYRESIARCGELIQMEMVHLTFHVNSYVQVHTQFYSNKNF